jgi:hypothetical protein
MLARGLASALTLFYCASGGAQGELPVDPQSGLVMDDNWELVLGNCSGCHSTRLVIQNRMSSAGWTHTIRWMQEKHNLWDLGENEQKIVAYLEANYGVPELPLRRSPLDQPPLDVEE